MPKDLLDELLNSEEEETNSEEDVQDETDTEDNVDETEEKQELSVDDLKAQIEELEKARSGLLKETKTERKRRQELTQRLDQLTGAVGSILQQREAAQKSASADKDEITINGIPVKYTDDGDAYLDPKDMENLTKPYEQEINKLKEQLNSTTSEQEFIRKEQEVINSVISEDERYESAYKDFSKARKWVENYVDEWLEDNGYGAIPVTAAQALTHIFDNDAETQFNKQFEGINMEDIVLAKDSPRLFKRALNLFVTDDQTEDNESTKTQDDTKFKKLLKKPSSLGKSANQESGPDFMDKVSDLKFDDLMNMSDKEAEKLQEMLLDEEKRDGIKFNK